MKPVPIHPPPVGENVEFTSGNAAGVAMVVVAACVVVVGLTVVAGAGIVVRGTVVTGAGIVVELDELTVGTFVVATDTPPLVPVSGSYSDQSVGEKARIGRA